MTHPARDVRSAVSQRGASEKTRDGLRRIVQGATESRRVMNCPNVEAIDLRATTASRPNLTSCSAASREAQKRWSRAEEVGCKTRAWLDERVWAGAQLDPCCTCQGATTFTPNGRKSRSARKAIAPSRSTAKAAMGESTICAGCLEHRLRRASARPTPRHPRRYRQRNRQPDFRFG